MPVRRLHNFAYCPRLFYLQWVENLFVESEETVSGTHAHRNVDAPSHLVEEIESSDRANLRSVALDSLNLGLTGIIDLIESDGSGREIIDYKRGSARRGEGGSRIAKENDALQVGAYALMLKEAGMAIDRASIYYAEERSRVEVALDEDLFQAVRTTLSAARSVAASGVCPPPLRDDPRCLHCSAYSICLPNESTFWSAGDTASTKPLEAPRPPGDEGEILVVQNPRAYVGSRGGEVQVKIGDDVVTKVPLAQIQAVYLYGAIQVSAQTLHHFLERSIPVGYFSPAGRFLGTTSGLPQSGIDARLGQARLYRDPELRLALAREIVRCKIHNQRVLLMRNGDPPDAVLRDLANLRDSCGDSANLDSLRGKEGAAAAAYFRHFHTMLKGSGAVDFDFQGRNRRPPKDPVNALLSQGYSILAKELAGVCQVVGLDPFIGFFHEPRYGRPALALDLMEEFRPLIADSVVISLINRQELGKGDFTHTTRGVFLSESGRKQFWRAWFRRMDTEVAHPQFGYRMSYRRMLDVQARQLWRFCRGDAPGYHGFTTR